MLELRYLQFLREKRQTLLKIIFNVFKNADFFVYWSNNLTFSKLLKPNLTNNDTCFPSKF